MTAQTLDIAIEQGADFELVLQFRIDATTPLDLTSWSGRGQIRRSVRSDEVLAGFTAQVIDGPAGLIRLSLPWEVTTELDFSRAIYDFELIDPSGAIVLRPVVGRVRLDREVTR